MDQFQSTGQTRRVSLRKLLLEKTGQDVLRCRGCGSCNLRQNFTAMDISLDSLIQLVIQDDEEVLTSRTLWSDEIYEAIYYSCQRGIDLRAIFDALRAEANFRNLR